jgi:hypothetical protein
MPHKRRNATNEQKKRINIADSIAGSMLSDVEKILGVEGLFDGEMTHLSFDCPKNLRSEFKQECKANGTTVCKTLQNYQLAYIVISRLKKHAYGNTLSRLVDAPIVIENLNCIQNVQSRVRRYSRTTVNYEEETISKSCDFPNCPNEAVARAIYVVKNEEYEVCLRHLADACSDQKLWKVVQKYA